MSRLATPLDPVDGILDALRSHDVVALCDGGHGCEQAYAFRVALIHDPRFAELGCDIVVESGNSRHQATMDRFIRGEDIPDDILRDTWQDTTQPHDVWDRPVFAGLFREVRNLNARLPESRRLRVLLGDPPIDWSAISSRDDYTNAIRNLDRDACAVEIIQREVLAKRRRALVIYGGMHFLRRNPYWTFPDVAQAERSFREPPNTIVSLLERQGAKVYSIWTTVHTDLTSLQDSVATWPVPSLARIAGTVLGAASFRAYYPHTMFSIHDGAVHAVQVDPVRSSSMQEQFNAILYLGPPRNLTWSQVPVSTSAKAEYATMRANRLRLAGMEQLMADRRGDPGEAEPGAVK